MPKENSKHLAYAQIRFWKAGSAWMGFLLLHPTAAAQGACLGKWHLINSAHLHRNLLRGMLSLDIQLQTGTCGRHLICTEQSRQCLSSAVKQKCCTQKGQILVCSAVCPSSPPGTHWRRRWLPALLTALLPLPSRDPWHPSCWPETLCWGGCLQTPRLIPYWESGEIREAQNP